MTRIEDNTFAAACFNQNSIADLEEALRNGPDATDMELWSLTEAEWIAQVELALSALREEAEADA